MKLKEGDWFRIKNAQELVIDEDFQLYRRDDYFGIFTIKELDKDGNVTIIRSQRGVEVEVGIDFIDRINKLTDAEIIDYKYKALSEERLSMVWEQQKKNDMYYYFTDNKYFFENKLKDNTRLVNSYKKKGIYLDKLIEEYYK